MATSVGFYYMSNAAGRLLGTLASGVIYSYAGDDRGALAGSDALRGLAACFVAGTASSLVAALITVRIRDDAAGLRCGPCVCVGAQEEGDGGRTTTATTTIEMPPFEPATAPPTAT